MNGYAIDETERGTKTLNDLDTNADTCCLVANFTLLQMESRNAAVYSYNPSYNPLKCTNCVSSHYCHGKYHKNSFIMVVNEALQ